MKELNEIIKDYLQAKDTDYALMINGDWGCGKTYYLNHTFKELVESQICPNKPDTSDVFKKKIKKRFGRTTDTYNYQIAFISLYGISSQENFSYRVFLGVNSWAKNKVIGLLGAIGSKAASFFNVSLSKDDVAKINTISNNTVLVFDDLERILQDKISSKEVLGLINEYTEHNHYKVIIVCNEEVYKDKANALPNEEEYLKYKEKTVRFTYRFVADISNVLDSIIDSVDDDSYKEYLKAYKPLILDLFEIGGKKNLRTLKFFVDIMFKVFHNIKDFRNTVQIQRTTTISTLIYAIEFKNGIDTDKLNELKAHFEVDIAGTAFSLPQRPSEEESEQSFSNVVSSKYGSYFQNEMIQMKCIIDYIAYGYLDIEKFHSVLKNLDDEIERAKIKTEYQLIKELQSIQTIDDDTVVAKLYELIEYVKDGKYGLIDLAQIYALLIQYEFYKLDGFELNDSIRDIFIAATDKLSKDWKYFPDLEMKIPMWDGREKGSDAYNKYSYLKEHILQINNQSRIRDEKANCDSFLEKAERGDVAGIRHYRNGFENRISLTGIDWSKICDVLQNGKNDIACELAQCIKYQIQDSYSLNKDDRKEIKNGLGMWLDEYAKNEDRRVRRMYILQLKQYVDSLFG